MSGELQAQPGTSVVDVGVGIAGNLTTGIAANLATKAVEHLSAKAFHQTRLGARLKSHLVGVPILGDVFDQVTQAQFHRLFLEAYILYFKKYPDRKFQVFYDFFASDQVTEAVFNRVFDFVPINYQALEDGLRTAIGRDWILFRILERQQLTLKVIVEDYLRCYEERERSASGIAALCIIREVRESEERILRVVGETFQALPESIADAVASRTAPYTLPAPEAVQPERRPQTRGFVGREVELGRYRRLLRRDRLAVIEGMPGIGKTWLASRLAAERRRATCWITIRTGLNDSLEGLLWDLARSLAGHGDLTLWRYLTGTQGEQTRHPLPPLSLVLAVLAAGRYLVCFDDVHLLNDKQDTVSFITALHSQTRQTTFLVLSRYQSPIRPVTTTDPLSGLDAAASRQFLRKRGVTLSPAVSEDLLSKTGGHPTFLDLFATWFRAANRSPADIEAFIRKMPLTEVVSNYLMKNLLASLSSDEQRVLQALSVFQSPAPTEAVSVVLEPAPAANTLRRLASMQVVDQSSGADAIGLHSIVQDFVYGTIDTPQRKEMHHRAALYYSGLRTYLESAQHRVRAGEFSEAVTTITDNLSAVIAAGRARPALDLLVALREHTTPIDVRMALFRAVGDLRVLTGDYDGAVHSYEVAMSARQDCLVRTDLWRSIGNVRCYQSDFRSALLAFKNARDELSTCPTMPAKVAARLDVDTAYVFLRQQDYKSALTSGQQGLAVLRGLDLSDDLATCLRHIADVEYETGKWDDAVRNYQESKRVYELLGNPHGVALVADDLVFS